MLLSLSVWKASADEQHREKFVTSMRYFLAGVSEQIFYYLALFSAFVAWIYFESIYAAIVVGAAGVALAWSVSALVEGKGNKKNSR